MRKTVAVICSKHGFVSGSCCPKCSDDPTNTVYITTYDWIKKGVWEHIDPTQPNMRFDSKEELFRECRKRGHIPRAFQKPCSQGEGYEIGKRLL